MKIEFTPISRFDQIEIAAYVMETIAAVTGNCLFDDIPIDTDQLLTEIISDPARFDLEGEEEFLAEEDFAGRKLAEEKFSSRLSEKLEARRDRLADSYPFVLDKDEAFSLKRKPTGELSPINLATFCLTLFILLQDSEIVQIAEEEKKRYLSKFEKIFEIISAYAVSSYTEGVVWWTGKSRDRRSFLLQLKKIAAKVNYGAVKPEDELEDNQIAVNDGGVDALGLTTRDGNVVADATCYLVGATYQKANRRQKIVGPPSIERLRNFFLHVPTVCFLGILAIPYKNNRAEAQNCRDQNCIYFPLETIENSLAISAHQQPPANIRHFRKGLDKQMLITTLPAIDRLIVMVGGKEFALADIQIQPKIG